MPETAAPRVLIQPTVPGGGSGTDEDPYLLQEPFWLDLSEYRTDEEIRDEIFANLQVTTEECIPGCDDETFQENWLVADSEGLGGRITRGCVSVRPLWEHDEESATCDIFWEISRDYQMFSQRPEGLWEVYVRWLEETGNDWGSAVSFLSDYQGAFCCTESFAENLLNKVWGLDTMPAWMTAHIDFAEIWDEMEQRHLAHDIQVDDQHHIVMRSMPR